MTTDNEWDGAIVYQHSNNGAFVLATGLEAARADILPKTMENGAVKYQEAKIKWDGGDLIVDFEHYKMVVTAGVISRAMGSGAAVRELELK